MQIDIIFGRQKLTVIGDFLPWGGYEDYQIIADGENVTEKLDQLVAHDIIDQAWVEAGK